MTTTREFTGLAGLVSGGAGGIGRATARAFARRGAAVVVADLEQMRAGAEETVALIEQEGGSAAFVPVDVTVEADVESLVARTAELFGGVDFAVNNAGIPGTGFLHELEEESFDRVIAVNLKGVWLAMKHEIRHMLSASGGSIVNTASLAGISGGSDFGAYMAAKHGVVGLTRQAASETANAGIRVNAVAPAATATPMLMSLSEDQRRAAMAPQPLQRLAAPEEIAEAIVFLCLPSSGFITGAVLPVDGGASATGLSYDPVLNPGRG